MHFKTDCMLGYKNASRSGHKTGSHRGHKVGSPGTFEPQSLSQTIISYKVQEHCHEKKTRSCDSFDLFR